MYVLSTNKTNIRFSDFFFSKNFQFLVMTFSIYLNRRVFVMSSKNKVVCMRHRRDVRGHMTIQYKPVSFEQRTLDLIIITMLIRFLTQGILN